MGAQAPGRAAGVITLAMPWALLLLPLPVLIWRLVPPRREKATAVRFPFFRQLTEAVGADTRSGSVERARARWQWGLLALAWVMVVVSLARPEKVGDPIESVRSARDVVLAIDISGSMGAGDFEAPDGVLLQRLAGVRQVVGQFISTREGDRIALIVFGTRAYLQAPLTEDHDTIIELLNTTEVAMAGPQTALGDAIGLAIHTFESSKVDQRLMILLSDGADTASRMSPVNAAEIAAEKGVEIFTIAVGNPEGEGDERVDVDTLTEIATRTGGSFFFATDQASLSEVYARIDQLAPRETERLSYRPRLPLGWLPLGLAVLLGLALLLVRTAYETRRHSA